GHVQAAKALRVGPPQPGLLAQYGRAIAIGAAAAALGIGAVAYLVRRPPPPPEVIDRRQPPTPPVTPPAPPPTPQPRGDAPNLPAPPVAPSEPARPPDVNAEQLDRLRRAAREQLSGGDYMRALAAITDGLRLRPDDAELKRLLNQALADARV